MPHIFRVPGVPLAYEFTPGSPPAVVFCPGYASDMGGTKAVALAQECAARGQAMLRFDYAGHGGSGGDFLEGTIGDWTADAAFLIEQLVPEAPVLLVGSSMGGWIALLLGQRLGPRLQAMILIAPAADMTEALVRPSLSAAQLSELETQGVLYEPSEYGTPLPFTLKLMNEGAHHLVLAGKIPITCPVHILHGMLDDAVPWAHSLRIVEALESPDVRLIYVKDGDHRLSRPQDLALLLATLASL